MKSGAEYVESLKSLRPRIFLGGRQVELLEDPTTLTVVRANARVYDLGLDPRHAGVMTAASEDGRTVSRCLYPPRNTADLEKRAEMAVLTSQQLGTCNYRCVGQDALTALAATTWEMDRDLGTDYHERLMHHLACLQEDDLAVSGALTDPKGDRSRRPGQQEDPDVYVHVTERRPDGIVVRGAKVSQSGAYAAHETIVLPTMGLRPGEEQFAVAFAVPIGYGDRKLRDLADEV